MAVEPHIRLAEAERLARRDPQLLLDEVETRDRLGHRVLHLQPRVHLEEEELPPRRSSRNSTVPAFGYPARPGQAQRPPRPSRSRSVARHGRRRRLLDQLLVAPLDAALALAEVDQVPVRIAQDLDLDVPGSLDVSLEQQAVVAERRRGLPARRRQRLRQRGAGRARPASRVRPRPRPP